MAARLNVKFIGIGFIAFSVAVAIIGAVWIIQIKGSATRNIRTGDEAMEAGDYKLAKEAYGRAVYKEQTNPEYLKKFESAILAYQPVTREEASAWYQEWLKVLAIDALYRSGDPATHERLIGELIRRATLLNSEATWGEIESAAGRMWDTVSAENPERVRAKYYTGLAASERVAVLPLADVTDGEKDLETFLEAKPDSDEGWATLTRMRLSIVQRLRAERANTQYEQKLKELRETRAKGVEAAPDGFEMAMANARVLHFLRSIAPTEVSQEQLDQAIGRTIDLAESATDGLLLIKYAQLMRELGSERGLRAAVELLRSRVENDEQAIFERLGVARGYLVLGDLEDAEQFANMVVDAPPLKTSLVSQAQFDLRREASRMLVDVAVRRWDLAKGDERDAMMEKVDAARTRLAKFSTGQDDPLMLWADGRIALIKGDFETAAAKLEQYLKPDTNDLETMMLSAKALEEIRQFGKAYERVRTVSEVVPGSVPVLVQRARLEYNIGRPKDAQATLDRAEKISPGDPMIASVRQAIAERAPGATAKLSDDEAVNALLIRARDAMAANDTEGAREGLHQALQLAPNDLATLKLLFNLEVAAGNLTEAKELAQKGLAIAPEDRELLRVSALLTHDDPIEAIKQYVTMTQDDEGERAVNTMINLRALATQQQAKAQAAEKAGDAAEAAKARDLAARAEKEADALVARAEQLAPNNRLLIEHLFLNATLKRNWDEAQKIVDRAAAANADRANGALYKGRLALARGDYESAVRSFIPATTQLSYSAYAWRLLGMAYEGAGNVADASRAYQRSYECNPNDLATLRIYCDLLVRVGEATRAISMLRNAANLLADTSPAVEYWLGLEAEHGEIGVVLKRRREMYERNHENIQNALQLATLLGQVKPRRDLIVDKDGNPTYAGTRWDRMRADEQRKIIGDTQNAWLDESERILKDLEKQGVKGLPIVNVRARNALARNQAEAGETMLRDFVESHRSQGTLTINMLLALAQYLADAKQFEEARDVLVSAKEIQDPTRHEADLMLGDLYFRANRFEQAAEAFRAVVDAGGNTLTRQRLVECYIKIRKFDDAARELKALQEGGTGDYINAMLEAAIAEGRGEDHFAAGRQADAQREFEAQRAALDRAMALAPSQPMPHVQRALSYLAEFRRTKDASVLDKAAASLDAAAQLRADFPAVSIARADVLIAGGNLDSAIGELGRLLAKSPDNIAVRRRLIELLLDSGRINEAGNMLLEATTLYPDAAIWYERYGDFKVSQNDINAAEPMYLKAYQIEPTRNLLAKLATARMRVTPPMPRQAIEVLAAHPDDVAQDPTLRGLLAEALHNTNRHVDALEQMRLAHRQFQDAIKRGDLPAEGIAQWYMQLRKLFTPQQLADAERFAREVIGDAVGVFDLQWLARLWVDGGEAGVARAIELQREAIAKCPTDDKALRTGLLNDLSQYHIRAGDLSEALDVLEQLTTEQPENAMAHNNLAYLMAKHGRDIKQAVTHAERANSLKPNDPNILDTLGYVLMLDGQSQRAEEALRQSIDMYPMASTHLHMAQLLLRTSQARYKVENAIRRAEELNPDPETREEINRLLDDMRKKAAP